MPFDAARARTYGSQRLLLSPSLSAYRRRRPFGGMAVSLPKRRAPIDVQGYLNTCPLRPANCRLGVRGQGRYKGIKFSTEGEINWDLRQ